MSHCRENEPTNLTGQMGLKRDSTESRKTKLEPSLKPIRTMKETKKNPWEPTMVFFLVQLGCTSYNDHLLESKQIH